MNCDWRHEPSLVNGIFCKRCSPDRRERFRVDEVLTNPDILTRECEASPKPMPVVPEGIKAFPGDSETVRRLVSALWQTRDCLADLRERVNNLSKEE